MLGCLSFLSRLETSDRPWLVEELSRPSEDRGATTSPVFQQLSVAQVEDECIPMSATPDTSSQIWRGVTKH